MTSTYPSGVAVPQEIKGAVTARFATVGGALVLLTRHEDEAHRPDYGYLRDHAWQCLGCGVTNNGTLGYVAVEPQGEALNGANAHAARCRAVPDRIECAAPASSGHRVVAAELVVIRERISQAVDAVRLLAGALTTAGPVIDQRLQDLAEGVTELAERVGDELAELCGEVATEVAEIGAALEPAPTKPRSRWPWRRDGRARPALLVDDELARPEPLADLLNDALAARQALDGTEAGWERMYRAVERVIEASSDPGGMTAEVRQAVATIHSDLTNGACECPVCLAVTT
jgi:hypothetical protein